MLQTSLNVGIIEPAQLVVWCGTRVKNDNHSAEYGSLGVGERPFQTIGRGPSEDGLAELASLDLSTTPGRAPVLRN